MSRPDYFCQLLVYCFMMPETDYFGDIVAHVNLEFINRFDRNYWHLQSRTVVPNG